MLLEGGQPGGDQPPRDRPRQHALGAGRRRGGRPRRGHRPRRRVRAPLRDVEAASASRPSAGPWLRAEQVPGRPGAPGTGARAAGRAHGRPDARRPAAARPRTARRGRRRDSASAATGRAWPSCAIRPRRTSTNSAPRAGRRRRLGNRACRARRRDARRAAGSSTSPPTAPGCRRTASTRRCGLSRPRRPRARDLRRASARGRGVSTTRRAWTGPVPGSASSRSTTFSADKLVRRRRAAFAALPEPWSNLSGVELDGYEIRHGASRRSRRFGRRPRRPWLGRWPRARDLPARSVRARSRRAGPARRRSPVARRDLRRARGCGGSHLDMDSVAALAGVA